MIGWLALKVDMQMSSYLIGCKNRAFASSLVRNDRCDPSSNRILVLASPWLDDTVAIAVFKRQILLVFETAIEC